MRAEILIRQRVEDGVRYTAALSARLLRRGRLAADRHPFILRVTGAVTLFLTAVALANSPQSPVQILAAVVVAASFVVAPLLRWQPWWIVAIATMGSVAAMAAGASEDSARLYVVTAMFLFSLRQETTTVVLAVCAMWAFVAAAAVVAAALPQGGGLISVDPLWSVFLAATAGQTVRAYQAQRLILEERARRAEETREQEARRRVQAERLRIARDLHDAVGHQVALISVQAGAMTYLLERKDLDRAGKSLAHIQNASEAALEELRLSVGLLRQVGEHEPVEPAGRLERLGELIDSFTVAGLRVTCDVTGQARPLPEAVDLTAYRLIQESLTNTAKHAAGSKATVRIAFRPGALGLTVENEGPAAGTAAPPRVGVRETGVPGHGIIGMQERAATLGGRLVAGPRPDGGFKVSAELPAPSGASR